MTRDRRRRRRNGWSRREFIAGTTALGVAAGLPAWLTGCGSEDSGQPQGTPTPTPAPTAVPEGPREDCDLQFDLSYTPFDDPRLSVFNSADDGVLLQDQTAATRAEFRDEIPALARVPDTYLTHYLDDVDLPADAMQLFAITGTIPGTGERALAGFNIHVPTDVVADVARSALLKNRRLMRTAKMRFYDLGADPMEAGIEDYPQVATFVTPFDTAVALVFLQPEIMNLDVEHGATIKMMIETLPCSSSDMTCLPFLSTLASRIAQAWPATESGFTTFNNQRVPAWARLVPVLDPNGNPILDSQGNPAMRWDTSDDIARVAASVARQIRNLIFDSSQFVGVNWHPTTGLTAVSDGGEQSSAALAERSAAPQLQVVGEHGTGATVHGVQFVNIAVTDQAKRTVQIDIRNHFLRYMSAYVQFANEGGDLPVTNPGQQDTSRARFLQLLNSNYTVVGIPLIGDSVEKQTLRFDMPAEGSKARLYFGSLGLGGDAFSPEALQGAVMTLTFNIGLPTIFLAAGFAAGAGAQKAITGFLQTEGGRRGLALIGGRVAALAGPQVANGIFGTGNSGSAIGVLTGVGTALASVVLSSGEFAGLLVQLGAQAIAKNVANFAGPLGVALKAVAVLADVATIAQSVAEVLSSPAIFTNTLSVQMSTTVTVTKDPNNFTFPARARTYTVTLTYDQASKLAHKVSGEIESGRTAPIVVTFDAVPSGGMVTLDVVLTSEDGWIVGRSTDATGQPGPVGPIANTPETAGEVAITIKELLIPLTQRTQYQHLRKLTYQSDTEARVWIDGPAPTATRAQLCQGQEGLCDLTGITLNQRNGMLGYGYQASGQGAVFCGEVNQGVMYMVQNISVATDADQSLKQLQCGFHQPVGILYDRLGGGSALSRNFFLQPTATGNFLQPVLLDDTTPFNVTNPLTWGRFSAPMDALAVHPMGYVVGINRQTSKMEILQLPQAPVNAQDAPNAVPFGVQKAGEGTRPGLMSVPVAVTVFDGAILVLESGNRRVQAFDVSANPVLIFKNNTSSVFSLNDSGDSVTYLDLGVDGVGYVYVLSFVNNGTATTDYRLDIYTPQGSFLTRTTGVAAARMAVDTFRNVYALNYEVLTQQPRLEPSLSHWVPSTPM